MHIPPGLQGNLTEFHTGGDAAEWLHFKQQKLYTNAFVVYNAQILLGYKKRGFGKDLYNGFGGKVEIGETSREAALRELQEEAGISAPLEHAGVLLFVTEDSDVAFHIDIYRAEEYTGVITESEEMRPQWFKIRPDADVNVDGVPIPSDSDLGLGIPYDNMWEDDRIWLPLLLDNRPFAGRADFSGRDGDTFKMRKWWFGVVGGDSGFVAGGQT